MEKLFQDILFGARLLRKNPGFAAIVALTLSLGIGANTTIFSVVSAVMLRPLSYKDPDRLVVVWEHNRPRERANNVISPANFLDWQEQNSVLESMAAFVDFRANLTGMGDPEEIPIQIVTVNIFPLLGVDSRIGRVFSEDEGGEGAHPVVILSHGAWQRRFGGDPGVLGRALTLNGRDHAVVGVMPPDFQLYVRQGSFTNAPAELWMPYRFTAEHRIRRGRFMMAIARLKSGVSLTHARTEMDAIARRLEEQYPAFNSGWGVNVVPIHEQLVGDVRPALLVLMAAVGFVLLIGCANVANLLLARGAMRRREVALRAALGAGRGRIVRHLLTESTLLGLIGGACGILLAYMGVVILTAVMPHELRPVTSEVRLDGVVLGFTLALSLLTGLGFGLAPALQASATQPAESLKQGSRNPAGGRGRLKNVLVAAEAGLAVVLLIAAGLMLQSFLRLEAINPGFDPDRLLTFRVSLPTAHYPQPAQSVAFFNRLIERLGALPGVRSSGGVVFLPFSGPGSATDFAVVGRPAPPPGQELVADVRVVHRDYFPTMGIPLLRGRLFTQREGTDPANVVIINETLAREIFPGEDPVGRKLVIDMSDENKADEIVGVVGDVKHSTLDGRVRPMTYWPYPRYPFGFMTIVVRTEGNPAGLAAALRREVRALDKDQPVADLRTMEDLLAATVARPRFNAALLAGFAAMALILACVGIYSLMAYAVAQRTREIGVRMALGSRRRDVVRLVVGQGMTPVLWGAAAGVAAAWWLTRYMESLLYGVTATDARTFAAVPALLACAALLGCYIPARRAARIDPSAALRCE